MWSYVPNMVWYLPMSMECGSYFQPKACVCQIWCGGNLPEVMSHANGMWQLLLSQGLGGSGLGGYTRVHLVHLYV